MRFDCRASRAAAWAKDTRDALRELVTLSSEITTSWQSSPTASWFSLFVETMLPNVLTSMRDAHAARNTLIRRLCRDRPHAWGLRQGRRSRRGRCPRRCRCACRPHLGCGVRRPDAIDVTRPCGGGRVRLWRFGWPAGSLTGILCPVTGDASGTVSNLAGGNGGASSPGGSDQSNGSVSTEGDGLHVRRQYPRREWLLRREWLRRQPSRRRQAGGVGQA